MNNNERGITLKDFIGRLVYFETSGASGRVLKIEDNEVVILHVDGNRVISLALSSFIDMFRTGDITIIED